MKQFYLLIGAAAIALSASAAVKTPTIFEENFYQMGLNNIHLKDGWLSYGVDANVPSPFNQWFQEGDVNYNYILVQYGASMCALSSTNFENGQAADQWLVSPEIEMTDDNMTLSVTSCFYNYPSGSGGRVPWEVYVSETGGAEKSDFNTEKPLFSTTTAAGTDEISMKNFAFPANGLKGKKVRFAFVQKGQNVGPFGFTNIRVGNYYCSFENLTPALGEEGQSITFDTNVYVKAPVTCNYIKADLVINGVTVMSNDIKKNVSPTTNGTIQPTRIKFEDAYTISKESVNWAIKITPKYDGAPEAEISGVIGVPLLSYPSNTVVEEVTASGCGFCPAGIAAMEYMADNYKGSATEGKFIGIAIHGFVNHVDPMSEGNEAYLQLLQAQAIGNTSYPGASFNRAVGGTPYQLDFARQQILSKTYNKVEIASVEYPVDSDFEEMGGKQVNVNFDVRNAFNSSDLNLSAAVVLIENNVKGYNSDADQTNYFYNRTSDYVNQFNPLIIQYMKKFLSGGEWGIQTIPFDKMIYNHVSRGIFPEYYGKSIKADWIADVPQRFSLKFEVPSTVMDFRNTETIVLILDDETGQIVASEIMPFQNYSAVSGVDTISEEASLISRQGDYINVTSEVGSVINVFAIDGTLLKSVKAVSANTVIDGTDFSGMIIVKANDKVAKYLF